MNQSKHEQILKRANYKRPFQLVCLFSHFRSRDSTPENCILYKLSYPHAYVCVSFRKDKFYLRTPRGG